MSLISKYRTILLMGITVGLAVALIIFPKPALSASLRGLELWWEVVFPSLLPFFITAELMIGLGVVHGLGALSERIMRPLFNVPGCGGFVWIMGMASGYPAGARWTADLRKNGQVTKVEAERLVAFTNASSPLFIFGAVAVGFFHDPTLGLMIAIAHYGGNVLVGIGMRFYKKSEPTNEYRSASGIKEAFYAMHHSRLADGRSLGKLMGDAVTKSVHTLLMVGGFIMLFSVFTELLTQAGVFTILSMFFTTLGIPVSFHSPFLAGILEMTTGINGVTSTGESLLAQLMFVGFLLGFHGFSIQAQIASILAETDINFKPYALARVAHGIIAAVLTFFLYHYMPPLVTLQHLLQMQETMDSLVLIISLLQDIGPPLTIIMIFLAIWVRASRPVQKTNSRYGHPN